MAKITELPLDISLSGNEIIPAVDGARNVGITLQGVSTYIADTLTTQINVTNTTNTFSRAYPVSGAIAQGQGASLFTDTDGMVKMRAADNSSTVVPLTSVEELSANINDFEFTLSDITDSVKVPFFQFSFANLQSTDLDDWGGDRTPANYGFKVTMTQATDEATQGYAWRWQRESTDPIFALNTPSYPNAFIEIVRVEIRTGDMFITIRDHGNTFSDSNTLYYRRVYAGAAALLLSSDDGNTDSDYTVLSNGDREYQMGRFDANDIAAMVAANNVIGIFITNVQTSNVEDGNYSYRLSRRVLETPDTKTLDTDSFDEDGYMTVQMTQAPGSTNVWSWDPETAGEEGYELILLRDEQGRAQFTKRIQFYRLQFNSDTNRISAFSRSNDSFSNTTFYTDIKIGDLDSTEFENSNVFGQADYLLSLTLATELANQSYSLKIRFKQIRYSSTVSFHRNLGVTRCLLPIRDKTDTDTNPEFSDIAVFTPIQNTSLHSRGGQAEGVTKVDDNSFIYNYYVETTTYKPSHSLAEVVERSGGDYVFGEAKNYINYGYNRSNYTSSSFYFKRSATNVWESVSTFSPVLCRLEKSSGNARFETYREWFSKEIGQDDESIWYVSVRSFRDFGGGRGLVGDQQGSLGEDALLTANSGKPVLVFYKMNKETGQFKYLYNETTDHIQNYFHNVANLYTQNIAYQGMQILSFNENVVRIAMMYQYGYVIFDLTLSNLGDTEQKASFSVVNSAGFVNVSYEDIPIESFYNSQTRQLVFSYFEGRNRYKYIRAYQLNNTLTRMNENYNSSTLRFDNGNLSTISVYDYIATSLSKVASVQSLNVRESQEYRDLESIYGLNFSGGRLTGTRAYATGNVKENNVEFFNDPSISAYSWVIANASSNRYPHKNNNVLVTYLRTSEIVATNTFYDWNIKLKQLDPELNGQAVRIPFDPRIAVGISLADYADGDTGNLGFLTGSSVLTLSGFGLIVGADYFLDNNTGLLNPVGGRLIGRAISGRDLVITNPR